MFWLTDTLRKTRRESGRQMDRQAEADRQAGRQMDRRTPTDSFCMVSERLDNWLITWLWTDGLFRQQDVLDGVEVCREERLHQDPLRPQRHRGQTRHRLGEARSQRESRHCQVQMLFKPFSSRLLTPRIRVTRWFGTNHPILWKVSQTTQIMPKYKPYF